jgi:hypothetical protein
MPLQAFYLGFNCWFRMPRVLKVTVTDGSDDNSFLYSDIDYQKWDDPRVIWDVSMLTGSVSWWSGKMNR